MNNLTRLQMKTYLVLTIMANYVKTCHRRRSIELVSILFSYVLLFNKNELILLLTSSVTRTRSPLSDMTRRCGEARLARCKIQR